MLNIINNENMSVIKCDTINMIWEFVDFQQKTVFNDTAKFPNT